MREVLSFVRAQDAYFLLGLSAVCLLLLLHNVSLSGRLSRTARRGRGSSAEGHTEDIAQCLMEHSDALAAFDTRLEGLATKQEQIASELERCLKNVGIVRFNAFDDIGGEQSFALALLDAQLNGILVSSLYGRQDSRLYAKGIVKGHGERPLSGEEQRAMEKALSVREV